MKTLETRQIGVTLAVLSALLMVLACGSSAAADEPESPGAPSGSRLAACVETPRTIALSESTPLDLSAAEILAAVEGEQEVVLHWRDTSDLCATHREAGKKTRLTLRVAHDGENPTFVESTGGGCPENPEVGAPCRVCTSRFEIGVSVILSTDDGSLDGVRFEGTLVTSSKGGIIRTERSLGDVAGSYLSDITPKPGREPAKLVLETAFGTPVPGAQRVEPGIWNGFVALRLEGKAGSPVNVAHGYWPSK